MSAKPAGVLFAIVAAFALGVVLGGFIILTPSAKVSVIPTAVPQGVRTLGDAQGLWKPIGPLPFVRPAFEKRGNPPVPFSGRISSIAVDPADSLHWLLGVGFGGVWETRDAGTTWASLTDGAPTLATGAIAFDPTNPRTIYVGTGEPQNEIGIGGVGILKSADGGQTWTVIGAESFARGSVKRLRINPANPRELTAASLRGGFGRQIQSFPQTPPPYGLLRSTDAGQTWVSTLAGQATALEVNPANFNRQYAAIGERDLTQTAGAVVNGVYRSTDAGQHWTLMPGPWGASSPTQFTTGVIELALAPSDPNTVYASIAQPVLNNARILGLYRTDNAWDDVPTWRQISIAQTTTSIGGTPGSYCINCESHVISVNPVDPNVVLAGGKELLWRCTNCGSAPQWSLASANMTTDLFVDHRAIAWAGLRMILGNDGGVYSTTDGASWQNHNTPIQTTMFYNGSLHPTDPGFIVGGGRDRAMMVRQGGSALWAEVTPEVTGTSGDWAENEVALSSRHPETDWMTSVFSGNGVFRTLDGGRTFTRVDTGFDSKTGAQFVTPVRKCPFNDDVFLYGSNRLWRTDNFFNSTLPSWSLNGPTGANATSETSGIYTINFARSDTSCSTYAYGNGSGEIRLTRDGGQTWISPDPNRTLPRFGINGIAFDPTNSDTIYVAISAFPTAAQGSTVKRHVYKTTNASAASPTWTNISPNEDVPFDVIVVDPRNSNLVYAGSDTGLWVSGDAGATWDKVGPDRGLPHAAIYWIEVNPATNQTVVFTHGRGAFQLVADSAPASANGRQPH